MREVEFRALGFDNNFVYGYLIKMKKWGGYAIFPFDSDDVAQAVSYKTIGEYTGLKDSKRTEIYPDGQKIFEGDIVKHFNKIQYPKEYTVSKIIYDAKRSAFRKQNLNGETWDLGCKSTYEVIGNIYENPELLNLESLDT